MSLRDVMVVVQKGDHSLGYYDFASGAELARVALDPFPHEFTLSPDRQVAYVAHFGVALAEQDGPGGNTVSVVDVPGRRRIGTVACGAYRRPHDVAFDRQGCLYVVCEGSSMLLVVPDPASGQIARALPTGGHGSHIISVTQDGTVAFCSNMESNTVTAVFPQEPDRPAVVLPVGQRPEGSVFDPEERWLFVCNRESNEISIIDVKGLAVASSIPTPPGPVRICRDQQRLLVALYHGCGLALIEIQAPTRPRLVSIPAKAVSVGYHPASRTALLSTHDHCVCLVDTAAERFTRAIPTRSDPDPMVVVSLHD